MSGLDSIPVVVEGESGGDTRTQNLKPLMLQVEQAIEDLINGGAGTVIDLTAMPFSDRDEEDLRQQLGRGEVAATVNAFGPTLVEETALPGVWLVEHKDAEERRLTLHLEVCRVPAILVVPEGDIADGLESLRGTNRTQET
jgi:hydrogenase-1 operon protein HyaF